MAVVSAGDGTPKVDKLRQAVSTFTALMLPGDGLGIVRFDDTVQRLLDVTDVGPTSPVAPGSGRDRAQQIVAGNDLDPAGDTSIGGGVNEGKATLDSVPATTPPWAVEAMLVVTDGKENTPPKRATISRRSSTWSTATRPSTGWRSRLCRAIRTGRAR